MKNYLFCAKLSTDPLDVFYDLSDEFRALCLVLCLELKKDHN